MLYYAKVIACRITAEQWEWLIFLILLGTLLVIFLEKMGGKKGVETRRFTKSLMEMLSTALLLRTPGTEHQANMVALWSWYQGFFQNNDEIRWQIYFNILLFVPFSFFSYLRKARPLRRILLRGFLLSLLVEACQYLFCLGLFEWDDLFHNSLGCLLGAGCGKIVKRVG